MKLTVLGEGVYEHENTVGLLSFVTIATYVMLMSMAGHADEPGMGPAGTAAVSSSLTEGGGRGTTTG